MADLGTVLLTNAVTASVLGVIVAGIAYRLRRPEILHLLWVVVLLDLLTPPVFEVGVGPIATTALGTTLATGTQDVSMLRTTSGSRALGELPAPSILSIASTWILPVWVAGIACAIGLAWTRSRRFAKAARWARPVDERIARHFAELAREAGVFHVPRLRIVNLRVPPMLRRSGGSFEILFPRDLWVRLSSAERDALLLHELAHVRRRDPWVRWLELAATIVFWWHPLVFWARRSLRRAEEMCCDAWVLAWRPGQGRDYAEGLLKTLEYLAGSGVRVPALASGAGDFRGLEERLTMIVNERRASTLARPVRWILLVAALAGLMAFPIAAGRGDAAAEPRLKREARVSYVATPAPDAEDEADAEAAAEDAAHARDDMRRRRSPSPGESVPRIDLAAREVAMKQLSMELERLAAQASDEASAQVSIELQEQLVVDAYRAALEERQRELDFHAGFERAGELDAQREALELAKRELHAAKGGDLESAVHALREAVDEIRGLARAREEVDRELKRALDEVERKLRELD